MDFEAKYQEQSRDIDTITQLHAKSVLVRMLCRIECRWRRFRTRPMLFRVVKGLGRTIGEPVEIVHYPNSDGLSLAGQGRMTELVLLQGMRVNAYEILDTDKHSQTRARTRIQPRWVD